MTEVLYARGDQSENLIQTCIFGLGVLAQKYPQMMPNATFNVSSVLQAIQWVYAKNLKNEKGKRAECEDNAIGALGKCIYFHSAGVPQNVIEPGFLAKLPLTTDTEEAQPVHALFLEQIIAGNQALAAHTEAVKAAV